MHRRRHLYLYEQLFCISYSPRKPQQKWEPLSRVIHISEKINMRRVCAVENLTCSLLLFESTLTLMLFKLFEFIVSYFY